MAVILQNDNERCDESCYSAKGKTCMCICGGKNHGVGLHKAIENTEEYKRTLLNQGITWLFGIKFFPKPIQETLFSFFK